MSPPFRGPRTIRLGVVPYAVVVGKQQQTALNRRSGIQNGINMLVKTHLRPQRNPTTGSYVDSLVLVHD
jgi:hypothetical protein